MTNEQKFEYNKLLKRIEKAKNYLDNQNIDINKRKQYVPLFSKLMVEANKIIKQHNLSDEHIAEGFKDVE